MMDLLENIDVLCKKCKVPMERGNAVKEGFRLRAFRCPDCKSQFFHPADLEKYEQYKTIKEREFNMKLRMIGNSFCISIPREIIRFAHVEENSMVSLSMEDGEKVRMIFHQKKIIKGEPDESD
jgi:transposase-like protein